MTKRTKPDYSAIWGELGDNTKPLDSYIKNGWEAVKPPRQYMNWIHNRQDNMLAYLNQAGIPEWDETTEYEGGFSYVQGSDQKIYKCLSDSTGDDPTDQPANAAFWEEAFAGKSDFDTLSDDLDDLTTATGDGSCVTNAAAWRTALSVSSTADTVLDADFTGSNQSKAEEGYQKLPGGIILQWGRTSSIGDGGSVTVTFPTPFPTAAFIVMATPEDTSGHTDVVVRNITTTDFQVYHLDLNAGNAIVAAHWFAVGH